MKQQQGVRACAVIGLETIARKGNTGNVSITKTNRKEKTMDYIQRNYAITIDDKYLYITVIRTGFTVYTEYNEEFEEIMRSGILTDAFTIKTGYLMMYAGKDRYYFHHIVYCFYHRGLTLDNYAEVLKNFREELQAHKLEIDHLQDGNINNCSSNLSLMTHTENLKKLHILKVGFKTLFDLKQAYDGNKYRVQLAYLARNHRVRVVRYSCQNGSELNNLYKYLKNNKWVLRRTETGRLAESGLYKLENRGFFGDVIKPLQSSRDMQGFIASLPETEFCRW